MILRNLVMIDGRPIDLFFENKNSLPVELDLDEALVFPGLVNSHDHLDFNCFPQLGSREFSGYTDWGPFIQQRYKKIIQKVLTIPLSLRAQWGMYKNLLCGVTTVINHGAQLKFGRTPIRIYQEAQSLHSIQFEKLWKLKLNNPLSIYKKCMIHIGEGKDEAAGKEINELLKWNFLQRDLVGIHAIAMDALQSSQFKAIVWCPLSNDHLYRTTAKINQFPSTLLFGTDACLTGSWNIWDHLCFARNTRLATDQQIFDMLTVNAGKIWGLHGYESRGKLPADIVIAKKNKELKGFDAFYNLQPSDLLLVISKGVIVLFDETLHDQLHSGLVKQKESGLVVLGESAKFVSGDLNGLMKEIKNYYPEASFPIEEKINIS